MWSTNRQGAARAPVDWPAATDERRPAADWGRRSPHLGHVSAAKRAALPTRFGSVCSINRLASRETSVFSRQQRAKRGPGRAAKKPRAEGHRQLNPLACRWGCYVLTCRTTDSVAAATFLRLVRWPPHGTPIAVCIFHREDGARLLGGCALISREASALVPPTTRYSASGPSMALAFSSAAVSALL